MFAKFIVGFRNATARPQRTKADWAIEMAQILDTRYAKNDIVTLVCDNLNTHTKGAFYEVFEPSRARAYVKRLDFCYTPKHGSWLNVAECELSCMTSQCFSDRRIAEVPETSERDQGLVRANQREATSCRLAIPYRRRPREAQTPLPQN